MRAFEPPGRFTGSSAASPRPWLRFIFAHLESTEIGAPIHGQMTVLPTQAEQWRAAATELSVNAALSTIPDVRSSMFRLAEAYQGMARVAEESYASYLREERIVCFGGRVFLCI